MRLNAPGRGRSLSTNWAARFFARAGLGRRPKRQLNLVAPEICISCFCSSIASDG